MQKLLDKASLTASKLLKYGVAAIMLAVPLYPKFPFFRLPGISVAVRLEDFVIFTVLLIWFVSVVPQIKKIITNKVTISIALFLSVGFLSVLAGIFLTNTVVPYVGLLHWARRVEYLSLFFVGMSALKKKEDLNFYLKIILIIVVFAFFYGVGQKHFGIPIITTQNADYSRGVALRWRPEAHLVSTFAGHYDLAAFLILVLPMLYLFVTAPRDTLKKFIPDTPSVLTRLGLIVVIGTGVWLLMQTASRISLVSYLGSSVFALLLVNRKKFIPLVIVVSFIFAAFSTNLVERYMNIINVYAQEEEVVEAPPPPEDRSTSIRLNVEWPRAIRALTKNPITGTGYSSISLATDNDYLRMLGETGVVGFVSFFVMFGSMLLPILKRVTSLKIFPEDHFVAGIFAAVPGIMLNMVFIDILEASKFAILFWLMMGMVYTISMRNEKNI